MWGPHLTGEQFENGLDKGLNFLKRIIQFFNIKYVCHLGGIKILENVGHSIKKVGKHWFRYKCLKNKTTAYCKHFIKFYNYLFKRRQ